VKRFEFRLQRTMDWREKKAEAEKSELERLHALRNKLCESRTDLREELQEIGSQHIQATAFTAEELHRQALFTSSLYHLDRRLAGEEDVCHQSIDVQLKKCVSADRDHRLLEKLRDQGKREWVAAVDRETEETAAENWNSVHRRKAVGPPE
jgi:hypothetical protein